MVNPRVKEAFRAMKSLGINEEMVKPVLKKLLKLYEKKWELIEAENFRALADAIFEAEDAKVEEQKKVENAATTTEVNEEAAANGDTVRPLKRLRLRYQDPEASSSDSIVPGTSLLKPKEEPKASPQRCLQTQSHSVVGAEMLQIQACNSGVATAPLAKGKEKEPLPLQSSSFHERSDISNSNQDMPDVRTPTHLISDNGSSYSHPMHLRDNGKQILNPQNISREATPSRKTSRAIHVEDPNDDFVKAPAMRFQIEPKEEPITDDFIPLEDPIPIRSLGPASKVAVIENGSDRKQHSPAPSNNGLPASATEARDTVVTVKDKGETLSKMEIASTPCGKVRIDMSYDLTNQRPDFSAPSLQTLLDTVQDRYFRSHEMQDSKYSLMEVMKGMCVCFLELGNKSGIPEKSLVQDASLNTEFDSQATFPVIPLLPPCNSSNGHEPLAEIVPSDRSDHENQDDNTCRSLIVRQSECSIVKIDFATDVFDITNGQERVIISMLNKVNKESFPSFHYITHNVVFQHAYMSVSLARIVDKSCCPSCFGDCLSLSNPCACSFRDAFVYTKEGLLKEDFLKECVSVSRAPEKHTHFCEECPLERAKCKDTVESCKGHVSRKFIRECWVKCGCSNKCGNRVVQRGISRNLQVKALYMASYFLPVG
ncbi:histone modifying enzyme [Lithospermum erythrorhizon]|uniref:Histone modifying enzyme n=1 Tax=Lithospermum erythrorhizon TaxID=34254 RepID=A0AAV3QWT9_LITER